MKAIGYEWQVLPHVMEETRREQGYETGLWWHDSLDAPDMVRTGGMVAEGWPYAVIAVRRDDPLELPERPVAKGRGHYGSRRGAQMESFYRFEVAEANTTLIETHGLRQAIARARELARASGGHVVLSVSDDGRVFAPVGSYAGDPVRGRPKSGGKSSAERQAKFRAERVQVKLGEKMADTVRGLAADFDLSESDVMAHLVRFALCNRNWRQSGFPSGD